MYYNILDLLLVAYQSTEYAQCLDCLTMREGSRQDFLLFASSRYEAIKNWKASFYSLNLPVRVVMYLAQISDEKSRDDYS
ncbi:farnesyl pyrophosphate synthase-like protein [Dinothrombium tinctorium]|uniref:Farnesyl pyrophosphate synthase-like protein n=1 Tax=Dinothrombium tinctorium TaxID=1965070 RepID=A0A3S5WGY0_9ACAR|nr:farnesyl pyrophosphate synthase-like protein [Dinothrombium tinctorium]